MLGKAKLTGAIFNLGTNGYPSINVNINNKTIENDTSFSAPMMQPYGFIGFPIDNTNGVVATFTQTRQDPVVLGIVPAYASEPYRFDSFSYGESVQYSQSYSFMVKNHAVVYKIINPIEPSGFTATALIGEQIVKKIVDFLEAYKNFVTVICLTVANNYNVHVHGGSPGPDNTITFGPFPTQLQDDLDDLNAGKAYVSDTGAPVS